MNTEAPLSDQAVFEKWSSSKHLAKTSSTESNLTPIDGHGAQLSLILDTNLSTGRF